jgi:hypothetical protein
MIAGLGSLLGAVAGLGASVAVLFALNQRYADVWPAPTLYRIQVPWLNVGIALLVVPLVATLGAGLLTRWSLPSSAAGSPGPAGGGSRARRLPREAPRAVRQPCRCGQRLAHGG